jgi:5-formyltetrahydrofolate cyclo-ligase
MASTDSQPCGEALADGERRRALRRLFRKQRKQLPASAQAVHADAVARHFFASALQMRGRTLGLYFANENDGELSTAPLLARLLETRKRIALPVVGKGGAMEFYRYRRGTPLTPNRFGILEPAPGALHVSPLSLDVLLVPLVAFDGGGVRLGMGAGYYDRYLGRIPPGMRPRLVGLAHELQRSLKPLPAADWDVPLDGVLTEAGWWPFHS